MYGLTGRPDAIKVRASLGPAKPLTLKGVKGRQAQHSSARRGCATALTAKSGLARRSGLLVMELGPLR